MKIHTKIIFIKNSKKQSLKIFKNLTKISIKCSTLKSVKINYLLKLMQYLI